MRRRRRTWLLWTSLAAGAGGGASILVPAPARWWLLPLCLLVSGGLFMGWAYLTLKDPHYYDGEA